MAVSVRSATLEEPLLPPRPSFLQRQWRIWWRKKIGLVSLLFVVFLIALAVFGPALATQDPTRNNLSATLVGPSTAHFFGTDANGRDVYSRLLAGARISVVIGFSTVALGVSIGSVIGLASGFLGGVADYIVQRLVDALMAIPGLILLMVIVSVLAPSLPTLIVALSIWLIPRSVRVVRGEALVAREFEYILAARALGARSGRIMFRHILPNVMAPIIIVASVTIGQAILLEAALSFLGLGVPPPAPTWGNMLSGSNRQYMTVAPWLILAPGAAISLTVLAFNMLGDAFRDILDPRLRGA